VPRIRKRCNTPAPSHLPCRPKAPQHAAMHPDFTLTLIAALAANQTAPTFRRLTCVGRRTSIDTPISMLENYKFTTLARK